MRELPSKLGCCARTAANVPSRTSKAIGRSPGSSIRYKKSARRVRQYFRVLKRVLRSSESREILANLKEHQNGICLCARRWKQSIDGSCWTAAQPAATLRVLLNVSPVSRPSLSGVWWFSGLLLLFSLFLDCFCFTSPSYVYKSCNRYTLIFTYLYDSLKELYADNTLTL